MTTGKVMESRMFKNTNGGSVHMMASCKIWLWERVSGAEPMSLFDMTLILSLGLTHRN